MSDLVLCEPRVRGVRHEVQVDDRTLWYEFAGVTPNEPSLLAAAVALLPYAMASGRPMRLAGVVEREALAGLEEFVDYWSLIRGDLFRRVMITAEECIVTAPRREGAVAAFSGGVDATYQLAANATGALGARSLPLKAAVLVHGFDIRIHREAAFDLAVANAKPVLAEFNVPLATVKTNWRDFCPKWEMSFAAGVAGVLHLFAPIAGYGLFAPDEQYDLEVTPWGSNSTTNPMLGAGSFRIRSDGAGVSRTEKCRVIGAYPSVREHVRVCWQGDKLGANCQRCEKCIRTKLNFLAAGMDEIPALGAVSVKEVRGLRLGNQVQIAYMQEIVEHELPGNLRQEARQAIRRAHWQRRLAPVARRVPKPRKTVRQARALAGRTLRKAGIRTGRRS